MDAVSFEEMGRCIGYFNFTSCQAMWPRDFKERVGYQCPRSRSCGQGRNLSASPRDRPSGQLLPLRSDSIRPRPCIRSRSPLRHLFHQPFSNLALATFAILPLPPLNFPPLQLCHPCRLCNLCRLCDLRFHQLPQIQTCTILNSASFSCRAASFGCNGFDSSHLATSPLATSPLSSSCFVAGWQRFTLSGDPLLAPAAGSRRSHLLERRALWFDHAGGTAFTGGRKANPASSVQRPIRAFCTRQCRLLHHHPDGRWEGAGCLEIHLSQPRCIVQLPRIRLCMFRLPRNESPRPQVYFCIIQLPRHDHLE